MDIFGNINYKTYKQMATNSEIISSVRNSNKFLSIDQKISDRYILNFVYTVARTLIRQEKNLLKIFRADEIFQAIPCLEMQEVDLSDCIAVPSGTRISRSKNVLPAEIETGIYGYLIQRVYTHDNRDFNKTTAREYEVQRKLRFNKNKFYWIQDNYLYINEPEIECISIRAYFKQDVTQSGTCLEPYDSKFYCPEFLIGNVLDVVNQKLKMLHQYKDDNGSQNIDTSI